MKHMKLITSIFALGLASALSACSEPETTTDEVVVVEPVTTEDPMMATEMATMESDSAAMESDMAAMESDMAAMEANTAAMESESAAMESDMQADMIANDGEMPSEMTMQEEAPAEMN